MHPATVPVDPGPWRAILRACALATLGGFTAVGVVAQETQPTPAPVDEERSTGLPKKGTWTFNLDLGLGGFGFQNSLYTNVRPDPSGDLSDNWAESFAKPAISAVFGVGGSEVYGKISAVGERSFAAPPSVVGESASSFKVEDLHLGWRSGQSLGGSENLLDFTVGRAQYTIGHGLILWDGAGEGGSRGGYWSNARKAWEFAATFRLKPGNHSFEVFYLDRDEVPESDTETRLWGVNYDLAIGERTTLGASYLKLYAHPLRKPFRDGMNVYDVRAFTSPFGALPGLSFELEYVHEDNGDRLSANAFNGLVGYEFADIVWTPKLSYRYAYFEGDDDSTLGSENFDSLLPGFYDWGTWWQGEIAGEYFLSNSNLISHQVRLHLTPSESVGTGLLFFKFLADKAAGYGPNVTSDDIAFEVNGYLDWKINENFSVSFLGAFNNPGELVAQAFDRTQNFTYGMIYLGYSY